MTVEATADSPAEKSAGENPLALFKDVCEQEPLAISDDQLQKICQFLTQVPNGYKLIEQLSAGVRVARGGHGQGASNHMVNVGATLLRMVDEWSRRPPEGFTKESADQYLQVAGNVFRLAIEMARNWDEEVPAAARPVLAGKNEILARCNGWMARCLETRGRFDDAEQFFNASVKAVEQDHLFPLSQKLMILARFHRTTTKNKDKHKTVIRRWAKEIDDRQQEECEAQILQARSQMLHERNQLYYQRNKLHKAYNLGKTELLECVRRLDQFPLVGYGDNISSSMVHHQLAVFSINTGEMAQAELHLRLCLYCRLHEHELLKGDKYYEHDARAEDMLPPYTEEDQTRARLEASSSTERSGKQEAEENNSGKDNCESTGKFNVCGFPWDGSSTGDATGDIELGRAIKNIAEHMDRNKRGEEALPFYEAAAGVFMAYHKDEAGLCYGQICIAQAGMSSSLGEPGKSTGGKTSAPSAKALARAKELQEAAIVNANKAIEISEECYGENCGQIVDYLSIKAGMAWNLKRAFEAERDLQRALAISREKYGDSHKTTKRLLTQIVDYKSKMKAMQVALGKLEKN
mmetsp:Transcript_38540/g.46588  ORF Transcript_38540/g.46588 Transcript_38540/m.46588 type:complete len:577 (+) Transcript_38540:40-1770(+)